MTRALGQRLSIFETISLRLTNSLGAKHGAQRGPNVQRKTPAGNGGQPSKAVKETCFPLTVQRVVGGIEIDDDLAAILVKQRKPVFDRFLLDADCFATVIFIVFRPTLIQ
jgi:hypothetical protein